MSDTNVYFFLLPAGVTHRHLSDHMSDMVENTLNDLEQSKVPCYSFLLRSRFYLSLVLISRFFEPPRKTKIGSQNFRVPLREGNDFWSKFSEGLKKIEIYFLLTENAGSVVTEQGTLNPP